MPNWVKNHDLVNHFLRGYFDKDGCVGNYKKKGIENTKQRKKTGEKQRKKTVKQKKHRKKTCVFKKTQKKTLCFLRNTEKNMLIGGGGR